MALYKFRIFIIIIIYCCEKGFNVPDDEFSIRLKLKGLVGASHHSSYAEPAAITEIALQQPHIFAPDMPSTPRNVDAESS